MKFSQLAIALVFVGAGCAPPPRGDVFGMRVEGPRPVSSAKRPDAPVLVRVGKSRYRVVTLWVVRLNGRKWRVREGYTSNGITAPDRVRVLLGDAVDSPETWAAVFHDWLFTRPGVSRAEADRIFHELLIAYGVAPAKARIMYAAVSTYSVSKSVR
jgi:hypothetical protein